MSVPRPRFKPRVFTLAFTTTVPQQLRGANGTAGLILAHWVKRCRHGVSLVHCDAAWRDHMWEGYEGLATAVLMARELMGVPLASWELFEPPRGTPLFHNDPYWIKRRHRRMRQEFLRLRWPVRPSKRFLLATRPAT